MNRSKLVRVVLAFVIAISTQASIGCGPGKPVASAADLERLGNKQYATHTPEQVSQAAVTALRLMGYEVVTTEPRIRTAPRDVATTAIGKGVASGGVATSSAQTYTESVAWDVDVRPNGAGTSLHAVARATVNGQPMEQVYLEWAERTYSELMREITANLDAM